MGKSCLFEDVELNDLDGRTGSFLTNEQNMPQWILEIDALHRQMGDDIVWSFKPEQSKLLAQLKMKNQKSAKKQGNMSISFYISTLRILFQGHDTADWLKNNFQELKANVQKTQESLSIQDVIQQLATKPVIRSDTNPIDKSIEEELIPNNQQKNQDELILSQPVISPISSPVKRRSLPGTPTTNPNLNQTLKIAIEKLVKENADLKTYIHDVEDKTRKLESESSKREAEVRQLSQTVEHLTKKLEKLESQNNSSTDSCSSSEELAFARQYEELKSICTNMKADVTELFTGSRYAQEQLDEKKTNIDSLSEILKDLQENIQTTNLQVKDLETTTNDIQSQVFEGQEVIWKKQTDAPAKPQQEKHMKPQGNANTNKMRRFYGETQITSFISTEIQTQRDWTRKNSEQTSILYLVQR